VTARAEGPATCATSILDALPATRSATH
jgi:hypothetical protein